MKKPLLILVGLAMGISTSALAQVVVHTQVFDNTVPSGNAPISTISFKAAGAAGAQYDTSATTTSAAPVVSGADFLFVSSNLAPGAPLFVYADSLALGTFANLRSVAFELRNNNVDESVHLAILAGGQWYVSESGYGTADPVFFDPHNVDVTTTVWHSLEFTPGSTLAMGGAGTPGGDVTGYGFFVVSKLADIRIDNVTISSARAPDEPNPTLTWADWARSDAGDVDTGSWLGHINVALDPWVWIWSIEEWMYLPEDYVTTSGAWSFVPRN